MPLRLTLRPNERVILGGVVVRNLHSTIEILVENVVPVMRERDIMCEADAATPCRRIYFAIQLMYVDPERLDEHRKLYDALLRELLAAVPSTRALAGPMGAEVAGGNYYRALKHARKLIEYEDELLKLARRPAPQSE